MTDRQLPDPGMEVVTSDGVTLGKVKDRSDPTKCFRVNCRHAPDLYVPNSYVRVIDDGRVVLRSSKEQVSYLGWELKPESYRN